ncbi:MAG TPA: DUF4097 family beta strand repeat-containing protein [Thermoanaerobaculia bacterium]|nr:DUF4097 family beta strand repeat-containing protein [Thermoanaerobaculia bacterium]
MSTNFATHESPRREGRALVWALAIVALVLLSLAAGLKAEAKEWNAKATRTETFNASGNLKSLAVETVNGKVEIVAGTAFRADVDVTAWGATDGDAKKNLGDVKVRFENENGNLSLYTEEPGVTVRHSGRGWNVRSRSDDQWRSETKYRITVPASMSVQVSAVNGGVSVTGVAAPVELTTVNGRIVLEGGRRDAKLNTVNGAIVAGFAELPKGSVLDVRAVNGSISMTLPAQAGFRLEGHTMSGEILSSFSLPTPAPEAVRENDEMRAERERIRAEQRKLRAEIRKKEKDQAKVRKDSGEEDIVIDLSELNEAMAELNREMAGLSQEISRSITVNLNRAYEGAVGDGGATVRVSNLNGKILILAEGTTEAQAKRLTSPRSTHVVTVPPMPSLPRIVVREHPMPEPAPAPRAVPAPPAPPAAGVAPVAPVAPIPPDPWGRSITVGDVAGDYTPAIASGDVTVGKVSGRVTIASRSGQIRVREAGKGAEVSTAGGDIRVEAVTGDLKATTFGGDIRAGSVSGDVRLETSGGDVVVRSAGGAVTARTGGGDVVLKKVRGPVTARTSGGSITCEITSTGGAAGELATSGGDVTVTLPANVKADVEIVVSGGGVDADSIASQFPEISVARRSGHILGEGRLNGGGPKLVIRSTSGVVTLKKGPAA